MYIKCAPKNSRDFNLLFFKMIKFTFILFCLSVAVADCFNITQELNFDEHWKLFKNVFGKKYSSDREEAKRRQIWDDNVAKIVRHNLMADLKAYSFKQGLNEYADMTTDEFRSVLNGYRVKTSLHSNATLWTPLESNKQLPDTVDWRTKGYVTDIKNQFACGSCWSFSATGALEGQMKKKTGHLVSLSEQNLIDCSSKEGNEGCNGGWMDQAFEYIKRNGGVDTEKYYPYLGWQQMSCYYEPMYVGANCSGYVDLPIGDETSLQQAVATIGPISVAIDASWDSFHLYASGIYDNPNCTELLDHAVLVIGYGTDNGQDYWLVKNSWGTTWGMDGYIKMSRNKNNQCGIANKASYPLV